MPLAKWANLTSLDALHSKAANFTAKQLHFRTSENFTKFAFVATKAVLAKTKLRTTKVYGYFANKQVCKNKRDAFYLSEGNCIGF